jgi:glutathione synthase
MLPPAAIFIIDPPQQLNPVTDSTLAIMHASWQRGWQVFACTISDLYLEGDIPRARVRPASFPDGLGLFSAGRRRDMTLADCRAVFMRKDPPVDTFYLHATYILDRLPRQVLQINPARALAGHCEKLIPLAFPGLLPETVVTASANLLEEFLDRHGHMVVKPLDDCSGRGIIVLQREDAERQQKLRQATDAGRRFVQGELYLPEIAQGDKRVLLLGGEILGWLRRLPAAGDFRSNVNAGGHCVPCDLTEADHAICARLGGWLRGEGIVLAGVDIVGSHVLEVNITSPSCLREMNELTGERLEERIVDYVAAQTASIA